MANSILLKILQALLLGFFLFEIYLFIKKFKTHWRFHVSIWKSFTWGVIFRNLLLLIPFGILIYLFKEVPILKISWLSLFFKKRGSLIFSEDTVSLIDTLPTLLVLMAFIVFLIVLIPQLVHLEEQIFRFKKLSRKARIISSAIFGLFHGFVGVNLMGMILLMVFGYFLSKVYVISYHKAIAESDIDNFEDDTEFHKKALFSSTVYHACWNTLILTFILLCLLYTLGVHIYYIYF